MLEINKNTKRAKQMLSNYNFSSKYDIFQAYGRPSSTKVSSFYKLKEMMKEIGGYGMRITGAGSDMYSCAFKYKKENKEWLCYCTAYNQYTFPIN